MGHTSTRAAQDSHRPVSAVAVGLFLVFRFIREDHSGFSRTYQAHPDRLFSRRQDVLLFFGVAPKIIRSSRFILAPSRRLPGSGKQCNRPVALMISPSPFSRAPVFGALQQAHRSV